MSKIVSITFSQDLQTWEGLYIKGTTHQCPEGTAKRWASEGIVSIGAETPPAEQDEIPAPEPLSNKPAASRKGSRKS